MTTQDQIDSCNYIERRIDAEIASSEFAPVVVKKEWPKSNEGTSALVYSKIGNDDTRAAARLAKSFGVTVRSYELQQAAVASPSFRVDESMPRGAEDNFVFLVVSVWEMRFRDELARVIERRPVVRTKLEASE